MRLTGVNGMGLHPAVKRAERPQKRPRGQTTRGENGELRKQNAWSSPSREVSVLNYRTTQYTTNIVSEGISWYAHTGEPAVARLTLELEYSTID
jgi:hypothetical protein